MKNVIVVGGTSGIGKGVALRYSQDVATRIIIIGRNVERGTRVVQQCQKAGSEASFVRCDVRDLDAVCTAAQNLADDGVIPDTLVNCAGALESGVTVLDEESSIARDIWDTNYSGTLFSCRTFARIMIKGKRHAAILNMGSLASFAPLSLPAYTASKRAVQALTELLAGELGPFGIRVNSVAPGYTNSEGLQKRIAAGERNLDAIKATTCLRMLVEPADVANAVHFLCSDEARAITGVNLAVDAGWLIQAPYAAYLNGNPIRKKTATQ